MPRLLLTAALALATQAPAQKFYAAEGLELSLWAKAPMFFNPTNIDVDRHGRVWVAEAVNYRLFRNQDRKPLVHPKGDRIMVLTDTDGDGRADRSHVFVQDKDLLAPLGIAVFGNRVVVSCSPSILIYTDKDGDARFDPAVDEKSVFLTGFGGRDHDHGLHAVVGGPDGQWYFNAGNAGPHIVKDRDGFTIRIGSFYSGGARRVRPNAPGLRSDDGRVYVGGFAARIRPDGTGLTVIGHNFRNNYEVAIDSHGEVWQNDNDDQVRTCRTSWLMPFGNAGYASNDGQRSWQADQRPGQSTARAHWHQDDPGVMPYGDLYGAGSPTGICVYENGALPRRYQGMVLSCEAGRNVIFGYDREPDGAGYRLRRLHFASSTPPAEDDFDYKWRVRMQDRAKWFRPSDVCVGADGCIYVADWFDPVVGGHQMDDREGSGAIYRIHPRFGNPTTPAIDWSTDAGILAALRSPAPNVRFVGGERLRQRLAADPERGRRIVAQLAADPNPHVARRAFWFDGPRRHPALAGVDLAPGEPWKPGARPGPMAIRELAVRCRDLPLDRCRELLLQIAAAYPGGDRFYLEAFGTGCEGKADALYPLLLDRLGGPALDWKPTFADLVWRLHPKAAVPAVERRALAGQLAVASRRQAIDTLAFTTDRAAATAMLRIARAGPADLRSYAAWWLRFRATNHWREFGIDGPLPGDLPERPSWRSGVLTKGRVAEVDVDIRGARQLFLVVTDGGNGNSCDWADWAEPRLLGADSSTKLTDLQWARADSGWGTVQVDHSCKGTPLRVNGRRIPFGIGTHAASLIAYELPEGHRYQRFRAHVGLDNGGPTLGGSDHATGGGSASVEFLVYHDGPTDAERAAATGRILLDPNADAQARLRAANELCRSGAGGTQLIGLAAAGRLSPTLVRAVTAAIHDNPDPAVRAIAGKYFPRTTPTGEPLPSIEVLAKRPGDAAAGKQLFFGRAACSTCHRLGEAGRSIGPDLSAIGSKLGRAALLDAMMNPSASIVFGFEPWLITRRDGSTLTGMLIGDGDPVRVRDVQGDQHVVPAKDIQSRQRLDVSLMLPASALALTAADLADLAAYLASCR